MLRIMLPFVLFPALAGAAFVPDTFHGVEFGQGVGEVTQRLATHATLQAPVETPARIPVARRTQTHLIARSLELAGGHRIDAASFIFADGSLAAILLSGGATATLAAAVPDEGQALGAWIAHPSLGTIIAPEQDRAWILSPEALHPHLFLWFDPHLPGVEPVTTSASAATPDAFRFGARYDELAAQLHALAPAARLDTIAEPWLPTAPRVQTQLNLYGFDYAGFPRKAEVVFGDGRLQLVWILTGAAEEDRVRRALVAAHGEPEFVSGEFEAFAGWTVALRKDKPEVLLLADELAPVFRERFGGGGGR